MGGDEIPRDQHNIGLQLICARVCRGLNMPPIGAAVIPRAGGQSLRWQGLTIC